MSRRGWWRSLAAGVLGFVASLGQAGTPHAAVSATAAGDRLGICDRTPAVRDAILAKAGESCHRIRPRHLSDIVELDLSQRSLASVAAGDFGGLHRLRTLDLSGNDLTALPEGVFDGLLTVETLRLHDNDLRSLPSGVFDKLLTLRELTLHGNALTALPDAEGMFDDFSPFAGVGLEAAAPAPGGVEVIEDYLRRHEVTSVEEFIGALPPAHRRNFVMVYESQGLGAEFVSSAHPRVISWGADGKYLFAWQTNPAADEPFRSGVEFLIAEGGEWLAGVVDFSAETPAIRRPDGCASCHGGLNKPLWGTGGLTPHQAGTGVAQGSEEDARRHGAAHLATLDLMTSDAPRIAPLDFAASSLALGDARRLRPIATMADEFSAAVARQHAAVLFRNLLARPDREDRLRDVVCSYEPLYGGEGAGEVFGNDLLPSFVEGSDVHLQFAYSTPSYFYFHFGSLLHALDFRIQHHYWRHREDVRALFAGRSNAHMNGFSHVYFTFNGFPDLRFHAPGTATMEDELIRAFRHTFGHRAALHVENDETAHRVQRRKPLTVSPDVHDYTFPAYRSVSHEMQLRVCAHLKSANLAELRASGLAIDGFEADTAEYAASAPPGLVRTTVAVVPAAHDASVTIADANGSTSGRQRTVALGDGANTVTVEVTAADGSSRTYTLRVVQGTDYDRDDDGLIEVASLTQLDAVRHDLDGDGTPTEAGAGVYEAAFPDAAVGMGCPGACGGYELDADLDFDSDGSGAADAGDAYWNDGAGWTPIGASGRVSLILRGAYRGRFEGNGHRIRNLFINAPNTAAVGLFGTLSGHVRGVGLVHADVTGKATITAAAAALAGVSGGTIEACYSTGSVSGSWSGGLVGVQVRGSTRASFSTARVSGTAEAGGLIGTLRSRVEASYATGTVIGVARSADAVDTEPSAGGLTGGRARSSVANVYATGAVAAPGDVHGLVPRSGSASYWDADTSGVAGGRTTAALQSPTDYAGIYAAWNADIDGDGDSDEPWDFGTAEQYPALSVDFDGDGNTSWEEFGYQLRRGPTLSATPVAGAVGLTWTVVDADRWSTLPEVSYTVVRDDGAGWTTIADGLARGWYTDTGVDSDTVYRYQVVALVEGGEAARSAWVEAQAGSAGGVPGVSIVGAAVATEGSLLEFTLTRTGATTSALAVEATVRETGAMVSGGTRSAAFLAGARHATFAVPTVDDAVVEGQSTVVASVNAGEGYVVVEPVSAAVAVADNDVAEFAVDASPARVTEGGRSTLTVSIANGVTFADAQVVSLEASGTAAPEDYRLWPETLVLDAGATAVAASVAALEDDVAEEAETVAVTAHLGGERLGAATVTIAPEERRPDEAALDALVLSGIDFGPFDPATLTYAAVTELSTLTVAASAAGAGATVSVPGGTRDADGNWTVPLAEGDNEIAVTVTAQDGTTRTYTVTVRRAPAGTATCRDGTALADPEGNPGLVRDCETLLSLKGELDPTGDMNWGDQPGFRRLDLGEWDTVAVRDGRVREIAWDGTDSSISLRGVLPAALGELDALEVLRLDSHGLHGGLPETLRRLSRLEVLDLGYNWRMDEEPLPAWLGELTSLRRVRLHAHAPGTVPDSWSSLTRLEDLELYAPTGAPGAAGPVASWLGDLPALRRLVLLQRRSTGRIPLSLAREFDELDLRLNALAGCVPAQLAESENARASEQGLGAGRYRLPACALSVDAGAGGEVSAGATAELSATAAGHHGDATLVWSWTQESGPSVALTDAGTATPSFAVPARGAADAEFAFSVTVHDAEATSGSATAAVAYRLPGFAGTASPAVSGPVLHAVVEGDTAVATLAATDADTAAEHLSWRLSGGADAAHFALGGSGSLSFVSAKDYEAPDDADGDGTYAVSVEVSDGLRSATADLTVALVNRNEAPTAEAGPDQSDVSAGATVTLSGSATDPDAGDALTHAWTQVSGASVELSSPGSASATFAAPASGGALTFRLRATDAGGLWGEDEVTVSVRTEAASPIAGFTLVNGDDGADIGALPDGDELAAGLGALEIRADLRAGESVGSVHFALGGAKTVERTENLAPYELFGGQGGETFGAGSYTLTATPYAERGLGGAAGVAATVSFTVSAPKASVDRDRLVLTWRTPRDAFAAPRGSDFAVTVDGAFRPVAAASVSGNGVLLTLSAPVAPGQSVRVDYLGSAMHPLADARGAEVGTWTDLPAENVTGRPDADMHGWVAGRHGAAGRSPPPWPAADSAVTSLSLASAGLADGDLARLGALAGLERLNLSGNGLTDIAALAGLARLRSLDLSDNEVSDLWPLSALTGLRRLDVSGNRIADLSPLSELPRLEVLVADANLVTDAGALTHLVRLENLGLADNAVADLAPLADLGSLRRLDLGGNPVADASPLGDLGTLVWLRLPAAAEAPAGRLARLRWLRRGGGDGSPAARSPGREAVR